MKKALSEYDKLNFKKILVIQTAFIGDVILITPLIRETKKLFPKSSIDAMVIPQAVNLLLNNPHLDSVVQFDKRKNKLKSFFRTLKSIKSKRYDLVISPHSSVTTALLIYFAHIPTRVGFGRWTAQLLLTHKIPHLKNKLKIQKNLNLLSPFSDTKFPIQTELYPTEEMFKNADLLLKELKKNSKKIISIAPGSNWFTKRWPQSYYQELVAQLMAHNYGLVFIGSSDESGICKQIAPQNNFINLAGKLSLLESAAVVSQCDLMICNDSGAMHIANAMKTDVFVFFGPTVQDIGYSPIGKNDLVFEIDLDCRPCSSHGTSSCPLGHHNCMYQIKSKDVLQNVIEKLG